MKNKGMHQQPNAFTNRTGGAPGTGFGKPTPPHAGHSAPPSWQKTPQQHPAAQKGFQKNKKAA